MGGGNGMYCMRLKWVSSPQPGKFKIMKSNDDKMASYQKVCNFVLLTNHPVILRRIFGPTSGVTNKYITIITNVTYFYTNELGFKKKK